MPEFDFDVPPPSPSPPHPVKAILDALALAPIGSSYLFTRAEANAAVLFVTGNWATWAPEGDDPELGVRYWKVAEPE
jgi:hypothetical protein